MLSEALHSAAADAPSMSVNQRTILLTQRSYTTLRHCLSWQQLKNVTTPQP